MTNETNKTVPSEGASMNDRKGMLKEDADGNPIFDFSKPEGSPALCKPDSVNWRICKNPITQSIGANCAVVLEFADPRVRGGVWDHTSFRTHSVQRARRTGVAMAVCVFGAEEEARKLIAGVTHLHSRVKGVSSEGHEYSALDPELLDWVHATTCYGFSEAYNRYAAPVSDAEVDQFYRERQPIAALFRSTNPPMSKSDFHDQLEAIKPNFGPSTIIEEFLEISMRSSPLPPPLNRLNEMIIKAAVDLVPNDVREVIKLGPEYDLKWWERRLLTFVARRMDRKCVPEMPASKACVRMGLPANYLFT